MSKYRRKTSPALDDLTPRLGRPPAEKDEVTSVMLATGEATIAQIAQLFNTDAKTLPQRLRGILPKATRRGYKHYNIAEAASRIVKPGYEIEEFIRQMSPQELPPLLQKEYWNGQNARINYEKTMGDLWPTADVVIYLNELQNVMRMTLLLLVDDVNREESLTDGQRKALQRITDASIVNMQKNITEKFKDYHAHGATSGSTAEQPIVYGSDEYGGDDDPLAVDREADDLDGGLHEAEDDSEEDHSI